MSSHHSHAAFKRFKAAASKATSHVSHLVMKVDVIAQMGVVILYHIATTTHPAGGILVVSFDVGYQLPAKRGRG